jgi:hypothetical protein
MITEMAKIESKKALADLIEVIDEKGLNIVTDILKAIKGDLTPRNKQHLLFYINNITFDMFARQEQCRLDKTFNSIDNSLTEIEKFISGSFQSGISENKKQKKSTLKVITGGMYKSLNDELLKKTVAP